MTDGITTIQQLEDIYGTPATPSLDKVAKQITPAYRKWIEASKFCVLTTVGPNGTDGSPRGDDGPVVTEITPTCLAMPDWRGNNRMDSLRNIVEDGRASLMFLVPGNNGVIRINGTATLTLDPAMLERFNQKGRPPRSVILINVGEVYFQCARALMRSALWEGIHDNIQDLPSAGEILAERTDGKTNANEYDTQWPERAKNSMW